MQIRVLGEIKMNKIRGQNKKSKVPHMSKRKKRKKTRKRKRKRKNRVIIISPGSLVA
jgi:hypothetical protein